MTRGYWMGCWNNIYIKRLTSCAVSDKELALLVSLPPLCPSRQTAPFENFNYYRKPCIYRASLLKPAPFLNRRKEPDYSLSGSFLLQRAGYCRLGASFGSLPAGSGTFMSAFYSCGQNGMHNVEAFSLGLCPRELDLSNDCFSRKTLSSAKPPHATKQLCCFPAVLDGTKAPGKGKEGTLQGSVSPCSARFRAVPSMEACYRP